MTDSTTIRNIVVFGQTWSGKSSIINMLASDAVAKVDGGAAGCTSANESYTVSHKDGNRYTFWDTPGLNESQEGTMRPQDAVQNLLNLVKDEGANLLIYCIRLRIVEMTQVNYDLFWKIICMGKVPIVVVVTGLEGYDDMEEWWRKNEKEFKKMNMKFSGHACITSWKGRGNMYEREYEESAEKVWELVKKYTTPTRWYMKPEWFDQAQRNIDVYAKNYDSKSPNRSTILNFLRALVRSLFW